MEEEICMYSKFGYCRYKEQCRKKHYSEICDENETCQAIKNVSKDIQKNARNIRQKKDVGLETNAPMITVQSNLQQKQVRVKTLLF